MGQNFGWKNGSIRLSACIWPPTRQGGHALFALDYRVWKDGEPKVVLVEQEWDFEIIELAPNFETFIRNLRHEDEF